MAKRASGEHLRKGIFLVDITRMSPDDVETHEWFVKLL